eukprot:TRINITY_DN8025_c0_g1_i1.p1 TRINITY_DN8025_c0_g1~~TRINITY_DN8025_c0_g1_i1.p1  ORF type:complete len:403 (-),score=108.79 TRINITY_DN8025_c0_g1_i1:650-1807(-)
MEARRITESLPSKWYRDEAHLDLEMRCIFRREWQLFALAASFPEVNSFVTGTVARYPIVVFRTGADRFAAYHNVCRHRANTLVVEKSGTLKHSIASCGYHGWSYSVDDGALKSSPLFDGQPGFSKANYPLFSVKCDSWAGMVFINFDPKCRPLNEWLADLTEPVSKYNIKDYTLVRTFVFDQKNNWKTFVDGYQECYHCPLVHDNLRRTYQLAQYKVVNGTNSSRHTCPRREVDKGGNRVGGTSHDEGLWLWKYPNIAMSCYPNGCVVMNAEPVSATETRLVVTYRFPPKLAEAEIEELIRFSMQNIHEDNTIVEQCQRGLNAGVYERGPLHLERENGLIFFHNLVRNSIDSDTGFDSLASSEKLPSNGTGEECAGCPVTAAVDF